MTPAARLAAVLDILREIETTPRPADALAQSYFRARRFIGSKDRNAISTLLFDLLRHRARVNWWIEKILSGSLEKTPRHTFMVYASLVQRKTYEEIENLFSGGKFGPAFLDEQEKAFLKKLKGHTLSHPQMPDNVRLECPEKIFDLLCKRFGSTIERELEAMLIQAPLDLRVNTLKIGRDEAEIKLQEHEIKTEKGAYSPFCLRCHERPALGQLSLLREGALEIQDEGSQLVAMLVDPKEGERIVDFCAGAGGKTLALSMLMGNKGRIIACDISEKRLAQSLKRFRRAGLHNIETKVLSSERDPWVKKHKEVFDRVLVDAPCSGTGTWRRAPDSRWRNLGPDLDALFTLQRNILESASRLVRKGGRLVYATCSLLAEENEEQIRGFLDNHPDFTLMPISECASHKSTMPETGPMLSLTPSQHGTDGFFAAVMRRSDQETSS